MHIKYLGDSYDIVKQSFLRWLSDPDFSGWLAHPMFTATVTPTQVQDYERLLGVRVVSTQVLTPATLRLVYFAPCMSCGHLFLDPDTGLRLPGSRVKFPENYIYENELVNLVLHRSNVLTVVFDQSVPRGDTAAGAHILKKSINLQKRGLSGFAYISHACFWVLSGSPTITQTAHAQVLQRSFLPSGRFTQVF